MLHRGREQRGDDATAKIGLATERLRRVIGRHGDGEGPLVVVVGGMHGNEPGGFEALERVCANLEELALVPRGRLLALGGNLEALALGTRFIERDLNRAFTNEGLALARATAPQERDAEQRELIELVDLIAAEIASSPHPTLLLDLHSTSAAGAPFALMGDTLGNRAIALQLEMPVILGLEESVQGTLLSWFGERGHGAVGVEGGQHLHPDTNRHQEAAVWLTLVATGLLHEDQLPWLDEQRRVLRRVTAGLPRFVAVQHRHGLQDGHRFRMAPGFANFDAVRRGALLAHEGEREVRAPFGGHVLLPLYQGKGNDGFFIGRRVRPFWLRLSRGLRGMRLERFLSLLPGVSPDPERPDGLLVDRRIARLRALDLFHLLGYWRAGEDGAVLRVARRREGSVFRR
ncbi:succinylglutamate desuccinylase/aspartoacylase family protein [Engelhardtia mirabilis]|uniref:succinylglutamate desuccinylase/aspartoacylase family protein n=1 Tax=Engelhardtia mirabilis TaxID=2528011 RepID=UPI003AF37BC7